MSHPIKLWERPVKARCVLEVRFCEQQRKSPTDATFDLRILRKKYREDQKEPHCVFVDVKKDDCTERGAVVCVKKSGVAEKYGGVL